MWPSGRAGATCCMATLPEEAPERFSTTTGRPSAAPSGAARNRAVMSLVLPGAAGTTKLSGQLGKGSAASAGAASPASTVRRWKDMSQLPSKDHGRIHALDLDHIAAAMLDQKDQLFARRVIRRGKRTPLAG